LDGLVVTPFERFLHVLLGYVLEFIKSLLNVSSLLESFLKRRGGGGATGRLRGDGGGGWLDWQGAFHGLSGHACQLAL